MNVNRTCQRSGSNGILLLDARHLVVKKELILKSKKETIRGCKFKPCGIFWVFLMLFVRFWVGYQYVITNQSHSLEGRWEVAYKGRKHLKFQRLSVFCNVSVSVSLLSIVVFVKRVHAGVFAT